MKMFLKHIIVSSILLTSVCGITITAHAQSSRRQYETLTPIPTEGKDINKVRTDQPPVEYINTLYRIGISLAVVLAVFMIVLGGVETMTAGENVSKATEARKRIRRAIWGLVLLVVSYLILNTINPNILNIGALFESVENTGAIQPVAGPQQAKCDNVPYDPNTQTCTNGTIGPKT